MTSFDTGRRAEAAAAEFLKKKGCKIVEQNWRTRMCEIDIVAARKDTVYFCEVKYRATNRQGTGLDYITKKKLQQMRFAAESWIHSHRSSQNYELCAIEVSGENFQVTNVAKDL
jgi:uncharacterized protein (TIGR00252 family)